MSDTMSALVVKCDHCNDWFEPKIFTTRDIAIFKLTGHIKIQEQFVYCSFCDKKTFASEDRFKPV